jgi:cobalt/nickel transport system permease protein
MHIPDGYLSPSTCATLYAASAPFWFVALKKMQSAIGARTVPLLSVCAAFSFVVMMFNVPLPGGTTGHAVGVGVTAVVLGPWASMLAISMAMAIQALLFGDGGLTSFGANCFNMAVAGSLVAHFLYRLISQASAPSSARRVFAAALAGYAAINAAALLTAVELGVQPLWFRDASGAPLYAPYPPWIAVPAMMIGHLTIAGFAEGTIAAGVLAWLQHANPALVEKSETSTAWRVIRPAWIALALLMVATPLGLLAAGTAWGEWDEEDFKTPAPRAEIAASSFDVAPPESAPAGLERLSTVWTAPIPDYAPPFFKSASFGYILSALFGTGVIVLSCAALEWLMRSRGTTR